MSDTGNKDAQEQGVVDNEPQEQVQKETGPADRNEENPMPSPEEEEAVIKKKYGGVIPKKKPLISKDHERAFFDSADWALGKQGAQKPKGPLEALRPKLQPTPHQQVRSRRSAYAPTDGEEIPGNAANEDHDSPGDDDKNSTIVAEDQSCHS